MPAWIIVAGSLVLSWRACLRCERHHSHVIADCCAFVRPTELEARHLDVASWEPPVGKTYLQLL